MKTIALTRGKSAVVDDNDFHFLSQFKWCANLGENGVWYAAKCGYIGGRKVAVSMHRMILGFPKWEVDHRDGNGLNNRRSNLRTANKSEQRQNSRIAKNSTSGLKGVSRSRSKVETWTATIRKNGKATHLGTYRDKYAAAVAYDDAARSLFGHFAMTNQQLGLMQK